MIVLRLLESAPPLPNLAITPGHYLERYLVEFEELTVSGAAAPGANYRVFTETAEPVRTLLENGLADFLRQHPGFYLEIRDNALLAFHPERELEEPEAVLRWTSDLAALLARAGRAPAISPENS